MRPIDIFFSYAHEDESLMNEVRRQLVIFQRQGRIIKWHDRLIPPGEDWEGAIDQHLQDSQIILLFVSPAFLESKYCWDVEVKVALERHEQGSARVVPIILRPCPWDAAPFAKLQALPVDAKPLSQFADRDQACLDVARSVMRVVDDISERRDSPVAAASTASTLARRGVYRHRFDGDLIDRLMVEFSPPKGVNIPAGYQRRLNQLAADTTRDAAVRRPGGGFEYPAQVKGSTAAIGAFREQLSNLGTLQSSGTADEQDGTQLWFEYSGDLSPDQLRSLTSKLGLRIVHCGATLIS